MCLTAKLLGLETVEVSKHNEALILIKMQLDGVHGEKSVVDLAKQIPDFMENQAIQVFVLHALGLSLRKSKNAYVENLIKKEFPSSQYEVR